MPVTGTEIRPEHYYNAAIEHMASVKLLRTSGYGASALAAYLSGLSAECALRSLIPADSAFYKRHVFLDLARMGALTKANDRAASRLGTSITELSALWKNSLRFYSQELFDVWSRKRVRSLSLHVPRGAKAAAVLCDRLLDRAEATFLECQRLWTK